MRSARRVVVILLVAALAAAGVFYLRRGSKAAPGEVIPELLLLAPAGAQSLLYADLVSLRASPFLAQMAALAPAPTTEREYDEFVRATGFDYTRDLDRVAIAVVPQPQATLAVAFAEGRFDRERIAAYARRVGNIQQQSGVEVYVFPSRTPGRSVSLSFLEPNRIALAEGRSLEHVLASRARGLDPAMHERLSRVVGAAFFAAGRVGPVPENFAPGGLRSDQFVNLARSLRWFTVAARPEGERMKVALEGECDTSENARQLAGTLEGLRLLGQAALADSRTRQRLDPQGLALLQTLLRSAELSRDEQRVRLLVELTSDMLDAARRKMPAAQPAR